MEEGL